MNPNEMYMWEIETTDGKVLKQYDESGNEQSWKTLNPDEIVRVSFLPRVQLLPQHDVLIDINNGEKFIKRFGRGFLREKDNFKLGEYINCVVTNRYRFWVFSNGRTLITRRDYEVNL